MKKSILALCLAVVLLFTALAPAVASKKDSLRDGIYSMIQKIKAYAAEKSGSDEKYAVKKLIKQLLSSLGDQEGETGGITSSSAACWAA